MVEIAVYQLNARQTRDFSYECVTSGTAASRRGKYYLKRTSSGDKVGPLEGNRIGHSRSCVFLKYHQPLSFWRARLPATTNWNILLDGLMGVAGCERQAFPTQTLRCPN